MFEYSSNGFVLTIGLELLRHHKNDQIFYPLCLPDAVNLNRGFRIVNENKLPVISNQKMNNMNHKLRLKKTAFRTDI